VQTPVNGEGGAVQDQVVGRTDMAKVDQGGWRCSRMKRKLWSTVDDDEVATQGQTVHGGRGTVHVQVDEGADVAKHDDGGGDVRVQVDDEAELAKEVGPAEGSKTEEGVLMAKEECFAHGGKGA
jgi:hypothetical protein